MISYLQGQVILRNSQHIILNVSGVGYGLYLTEKQLTLTKPDPEHLSAYWIHTHLTQDVLRLYGFASYEEREFFSLLLQLPTVGPKLALAILNTLPIAEIRRASQSKDSLTLQQVPGIGKKKAEKLILELASRLEKLPMLWNMPTTSPHHPSPNPFSPSSELSSATPPHLASQTATVSNTPATDAVNDVYSALKNLGFAAEEISRTLQKVLTSSSDAPFEELLKECLKTLSSPQPSPPS